MNIQFTHEEKCTVAEISGRLDTLTSPQAQTDLLALCEKAVQSTLILVTTELSYVSSSGLRVFLMVQKLLKSKKGQLIVVGLKSDIKHIFDISGFTSLFSFYETVDDAKQHL